MSLRIAEVHVRHGVARRNGLRCAQPGHQIVRRVRQHARDDRPPGEPLERRTEALCLWCNGFLYGLGTAGHADPTRLPGDAGEIIRDFNQIMQAGVDESEGSEANESAYAELVEFVRVGVQIVYEQLAIQREQPSEPAVALH